MLGEWKSDEKVRDEYRTKASSKWSESSVFRK